FYVVIYLAGNLCRRKKIESLLQNACGPDTFVGNQKDPSSAKRADSFRQCVQYAIAEMNVGRDGKEVKCLFRIQSVHEYVSADYIGCGCGKRTSNFAPSAISCSTTVGQRGTPSCRFLASFCRSMSPGASTSSVFGAGGDDFNICKIWSMREPKSSVLEKMSVRIATKTCPRFCSASWFSSVFRVKPNAAPVRTPQSTSIIKEIADPLGPPNGSTDPARAAIASVVGFPSLSIAHPGGISLPCSAAMIIFPRATTLVEASNIRGGFLPAGIPTENGLVPRNRARPPNGAMCGGAFEAAHPII